MSFAEKLKQLRLQNNLTQEALGKRMNVSRSTIAGYETKNRQPSYEKLTALASLFRVPVDYLLDEEDEPVQLSVSRTGIPSSADTIILSRYRRLSARSKEEMLDFLQFLEFRLTVRTVCHRTLSAFHTIKYITRVKMNGKLYSVGILLLKTFFQH